MRKNIMKKVFFISISGFLYPCGGDPLTLARCAASGSFRMAQVFAGEAKSLTINGKQSNAPLTLAPNFRYELEKCPNLGKILSLDPIDEETAKEFVLICFYNRSLATLIRLMGLNVHYKDQHNNIRTSGLLAPIAFLLEPHKAFVSQMNDELAGPIDPQTQSILLWRYIRENCRENVNPALFKEIDPKEIARFLYLRMCSKIYDYENTSLSLFGRIKLNINIALTVCPDKNYRREMVVEFLRFVGSEFDTLYPDLSQKLGGFVDACVQEMQTNTLILAKCLATISPSITTALREEFEFCYYKTSWPIKLTPELRETLSQCVNFGDILDLDPIDKETAKEFVFICFCNHTLPYLACLLDLPGHNTDLQFDLNTLLMAPIAFLLEPRKDLVE